MPSDVSIVDTVISKRMIDAGMAILSNHDSLIYEIANTYDSFIDNHDGATMILTDIWLAMARAKSYDVEELAKSSYISHGSL